MANKLLLGFVVLLLVLLWMYKFVMPITSPWEGLIYLAVLVPVLILVKTLSQRNARSKKQFPEIEKPPDS